MTDPKQRVSDLSDVDLVRMLTSDATGQSEDLLVEAEAEALRRGLPIDEGFIPRDTDDPSIAEFVAAADEAGESADGEMFQNGGRDIVCTQCGSERFRTRRILLNTRGLTALKLDWLNQGATALICVRCGLIQLFARV